MRKLLRVIFVLNLASILLSIAAVTWSAAAQGWHIGSTIPLEEQEVALQIMERHLAILSISAAIWHAAIAFVCAVGNYMYRSLPSAKTA